MAWPAPVSRSSAGRSAVRTTSGTRASRASTSAGRYSAAAVPLVQASTAGRPVALARPRAKKAALRSSTCEKHGKRPSRTSARTSGVDREPGEVHAPAIEHRASSSANARRSRWGSRGSGIVGRVRARVVLLHRFAGTRRGWDLVAERLDPRRYRPLALDLRGHGAARDARPISFDAVTADILAAAPRGCTLVGYS